MIEVLFYISIFLCGTFLYAYFKEKSVEKDKMPFDKERLK